MRGRDPHEEERAASPLELLYDLTFVVAFGTAGNAMAHAISVGHVATGVIAFCFAMFAIAWAWINFSWFASAFDTDDWGFRLATFVQMIGVLIMALGLPELFSSIEQHHDIDNEVLVLGYVVMRVGMIALWARAAKDNPGHSNVCYAYIATLTVAQIGWVLTILLPVSATTFPIIALVLFAIELGGPYLAETRMGGTPWHPHHIAERYSLLVVITLGEGVIGTVASLNALVEAQGWTFDTALVAIAGTGLTFGLWWIYFLVPYADVLHERPRKAFAFGYGHLPMFAALAAVGAGLHVAAYYLEHHSEVGPVTTVLTVALPTAIFATVLVSMYSYFFDQWDLFHGLLFGSMFAVLALAVILAAAGVSMAWCLLVVALAPLVVILGTEKWGAQHLEADLLRLRRSDPAA